MKKSVAELLKGKGAISVVGAHDGLSARLGIMAGFDAIWASGLEISASAGVPDANILTANDLVERCRLMVAASDAPIIADCDDGFGNAVNVIHVTRRLEAAGVAGVCFEDNVFPKRNSFYGEVDRRLVAKEEHALKIRAAVENRRDLFVIARTEALIAGLGVDAALERAHAYADAGADAILVHSKKKVADELFAFARRWDRPTPLVSVPTTYDTTSESDLNAAGYRIVIYANQGLRSAVHAMRDNLAELKRAGRACTIRDRMVPLDELFELVGVPELQAQERRYLVGQGTTHAR